VGKEYKNKFQRNIKSKQDLAQTFLIITTLLITLKPNKALLNTSLLNNTTSPSITTAIALNTIQDLAFFGFITLVLVYYVVLQFTKVNNSKPLNNISHLAKTIALLFSVIIYGCLIEPIITELNFINTPLLTLFDSFALLVILVALTIISAMALENNYPNIFNNPPVDFVILIIIAVFLDIYLILGTIINNPNKPELLIWWLFIGFFLFWVTCIYFSFITIRNWRRQSKTQEVSTSVLLWCLPRS
jgi:hypothetical protein